MSRISIRAGKRVVRKALNTFANIRYITLKRIEMAQSLMLTTGEPLSWISIACGMADQAHLSRWFRRIVGEAPSQWRTSRRGR